ncbi:MAG: toxin-antitoxin system YwqK family antitoxin [Flavobacteriaceae bacterium]|nr:toxin-antitoxin system YwqK family antitoxin [Flavobacteriaceae bacterium]
MKKQYRHIIILLISVITVFYSANAQQNINKLDSNGKRDGVWKKKFSNNRTRYVGTFKHGKEIGIFKYYSASNSDHPITIKKYHANDALADVQFFTTKGVLESEGIMKGKLRIGKWLFYHENGKSIMSEENYVSGKLEGVYKTFYSSGEPTEVTYYKNGLLEGNYKKYSIKGLLYNDFNYVRGKLNGMAIYYSRSTGDLIKKGPFKNDLRVGTWENYVDGELVSTEKPALKPKKEED